MNFGSRDLSVVMCGFALVWAQASSAIAATAPVAAADLSILSYNVYGHPLFASWQRPERFSHIAAALERDFAQTTFVAFQESHVPETEILGKSAFHQVEGACGKANGFRPTGLRLLTQKAPEDGAERYIFEQNTRRGTNLVPESALDCERLRSTRQTRKGFLAVPFQLEEHKVLVVNLHLSPSIRRREDERALFFAWLSEKPVTWSIVVVGDFNEDLCADRRIREAWESQKLQAITCSVGPTVGGWRRGIWQGAFTGGQLDHILFRGKYGAPERRRIFHQPKNGLHWSDHDGIWGRWRTLR